MRDLYRLEDDATFRTVGQLRRLLEGVPDDARVEVSTLPSRIIPDADLCLLTGIEGGQLRPEEVPPGHRHQVAAVCLCETRTNDTKTAKDG